MLQRGGISTLITSLALVDQKKQHFGLKFDTKLQALISCKPMDHINFCCLDFPENNISENGRINESEYRLQNCKTFVEL